MYKQRIRKLLKIYGSVTGILLIYYIWIQRTGMAIPCFFHKVTGLRCPGCGITRMLMALLEGDWRKAFYCNQALILLLPVIGIDFVWYHYCYIRYGYTKNALHNVLVWIILIVLGVFMILRNISWLGL